MDVSMRYVLVDGQWQLRLGRTAMKPPPCVYTEARLSKIAMELVTDIDKETVISTPTSTRASCSPLCCRAGIRTFWSTGRAESRSAWDTNIPPHNLGEVIDALFI
jgi:DNA gyrase subunit A